MGSMPEVLHSEAVTATPSDRIAQESVEITLKRRP